MSAQDFGWGPPGCKTSQLVRIMHQEMRDAVPYFPLRVRREVAPLFQSLVEWLVTERRRGGVPPLTCSGGYNKRRVAGSIAWSNHAWGLAADFNAGANPMQSRLRTDMPPGTADKARSLGMRWGGSYVGRKDPMHFEFIGTPFEALVFVDRLTERPPPVTPGEDGYTMPPTVRPGDKGRAVSAAQGLLRAHGHVLDQDGDYGPATVAALKRHQAAHGLTADGICGPASWRSLIPKEK